MPIKINDKWIRAGAVALYTVLLLWVASTSDKPISAVTVKSIALDVITLVLLWEGNRFIIISLSRRVSGKYKSAKRIAAAFIPGILFTALILVLSDATSHFIWEGEWKLSMGEGIQIFLNDKKISFGVFGPAILKGTLLFLLFFIVYEAVYYFSLLRRSQKERDQLQKEKLQTELDSLKQQVNPHFLFNSLNSLSSLIADDPAQAEKFLNEMSKVYRYLLRNTETELTTVGTELQFIRSYFHLLKTRYGDAVEMKINVPEKDEEYLIPPLTLQLLVENAVKHNMLLKDQPLRIEIFTNGKKRLSVRNNLQLKTLKVDSSKIGLRNIAAKYRLLDQPQIEIQSGGPYFTVAVPLIEPEKPAK